ncbi:MAG: aldehyde dehydrogenase family protein [Treponema sp.]|jgi:succinate-semialdehyde dehydrogenase/glutarate-semialdehyde dehydrogenase|nr:aldehyde dehydrogenase family protein [Treponema sp.]
MESGGLAKILEKAREAQAVWAELPYRQRARKLKNAARQLGAQAREITETIHRESGKLRLDALAAELIPAIIGIRYYIKKGRTFCASRRVRGGSLLMFNKQSRYIFAPHGVVGIISPWNYPFSIPFAEVVMALLAGNAVILKVASLNPGVGRALAGLFEAAELPAGLFSLLELPGKEAGPALIAGGVDKLFFTGSTTTGRELMALAVPRLLPLVLELGGADAAIICSGADLDRAAAGIVWAGFSNAGQSCGGVQRVLVYRDVYPAFLEKLKVLVSKLRSGDDEDADLGPLATARQKATVEKQVAACLAAGAVISARSPVPAGEGADPDTAGSRHYYPATVLTNLDLSMPIMSEEIFGPVVGVYPVADDREAIRIANASPYGLTSSVWSRNRRLARRIAAGINAGAVMINDHLMSHGLAETPWGGFGDSGLGRTHGELGFREMLKVKVVVDDILPGVKRDIWWQPYSAKVYRGLMAIVDLLGGSSLSRRLRAIPGVLKIFLRYWKK